MPEPTEGTNSGVVTPNDTTTTNQTISFSQEQQAHIDRIIQDRLARDRDKRKSELDVLAAEKAALEAKLHEAAQAAAAKGESKDGLSAEQAVEFKKINDKLQLELDAARKAAEQKTLESKAKADQLVSYQKEVAIVNAAQAAGFIDPSMVVQLTKDNVTIDEDGKIQIIGNNKEQRYNSAYQPLSLVEYMQEFATQRPYLVRSDTKTGAGSTTVNIPGGAQYKLEDVFGSKASGAKAMALKRSSPDKYKVMKAQAIDAGLISG